MPTPCVHNGRGGYVWFWNADIQIAASQDVEVRQNDITVNAWGGAIMLIDQGRPPQSGWQKVYKTRNNYVHHNTITFEGAGFAGGASDTKPWSENYAIISQGAKSVRLQCLSLTPGRLHRLCVGPRAPAMGWLPRARPGAQRRGDR